MQAPIVYKLGFNQTYYTFTLILLIDIVLCCKLPRTKCMNHTYFDMRSTAQSLLGCKVAVSHFARDGEAASLARAAPPRSLDASPYLISHNVLIEEF